MVRLPYAEREVESDRFGRGCCCQYSTSGHSEADECTTEGKVRENLSTSKPIAIAFYHVQNNLSLYSVTFRSEDLLLAVQFYNSRHLTVNRPRV